MADWATLKIEQGIRKESASMQNAILPLLLGIFLARGNVIGIYPLGVAFGAALLLRGGKGAVFGILGVLAGVGTLQDLSLLLRTVISLAVLILVVPYLKRKDHALLYLGLVTGFAGILVSSLALGLKLPEQHALFLTGVEGLLSGGMSGIFWYALSHQGALWRGEFNQEQGMAWLVLLTGVISGLQGLHVGDINLPVVLLSFFVLFAAKRFGAGTASGVGAMLGFLPQLSFNVQNLTAAGIYALAGFCTGAFQRLGKLGVGLAFSAVTLTLTLFLRQEVLFSQLISAALGLLLFLLWPTPAPRTNFLKVKAVPEVETTVTKVKALAEIFDQIALGYQAAEVEATDKMRPEVPELMNVLVERVCQNCPTIGTCWEREFYKTYRFLLDLFSAVETHGAIQAGDLLVEWKRHCGRLKEMLIGIQFLVEQEKNQETWRKRLASNQEAIARQFQSVSHVIGNLAKELNARHNWHDAGPSSLARRRRHFLDVGVASFSKSGSGINGDNYASLAFAPTQHAFVISDGMGAGENAAKMSAAALTLLEQLLNTGFEPLGAVQALNSMLVLRSPEESFVTLDMVILDLESERVKLIKAGAVASYIVRSDTVETFSSSSLPAGILDQIEVPVLESVLKPGESLVMVSDGILDVVRDGNWLCAYLEKAKGSHSQDLADTITSEARRLAGGELPDDGVVLVVRKNYWNE